MEDYKEMYYMLFNKITDIIGELQTIQIKAEELLISSESKQDIPPDNQKINNCLYLRNCNDRKML